MQEVEAAPTHPATAPALLYLRHPCRRLRSRHSHILAQHNAGAVAEQFQAIALCAKPGVSHAIDHVKTTVYTRPMIERVKSSTFDAWLCGLRDVRAKARIAARLDRVADGNFGDVKVLGHAISELRIDYGPGYRVYFK